MKITEKYRTIGIQEYYQKEDTQLTYENPHASYVHELINMIYSKNFNENTTVLDLCSGNGLISIALKSLGTVDIEGSDKYMFNRYRKETEFKCYNYSVQDIADFNVKFNKPYDVIVCSYAFDIVPQSYRNKLLYALSTYGSTLILIRPNSHEIESNVWDLDYKVKVNKSTATIYKKRHV